MALAGIGVVAVATVALRRESPRSNHLSPAQSQPEMPGTNLPVRTAGMHTPGAHISAAGAVTNYPGFRQRPLPVAVDGAHFQWASADAKDTNVIRQLAHNDVEYRRMVEENARIKRRQLVYSKNTAAAVMQRARLTGEPLRQLALPAFDGQELEFAVERVDLEPSRQVGTFTGHLVGRPGSLVTLAFKFGREAFTVASPQDGTFLQGHPRESGEILLSSFDPDTYLPLPCGEPIKTSK